MCQRLAELGMELATATQRRAMTELQPRPERRMPEIPGLPRYDPAPDTSWAQLFALISRCVRQAILLEARIAGGAYDRRPEAARVAASPPGPAAPPNGDDPPDDEALCDDAPREFHPECRPRLRPELLEDDLAADTTRSAPAILAGIRRELVEAANTIIPPSQPAQTTHPEAKRPPPSPKPQRPALRPPETPFPDAPFPQTRPRLKPG